tara:strand:- start:910 stop:1920 length:1011 start_codon:yes stop_codon:yes gene_type:complete
MEKKRDLVIVNNEKIYNGEDGFYCKNLDLKFLPEELSAQFKVNFIARQSRVKGGQKTKLLNINIASNILSFLIFIYKSFKKKPKFLVISITPYTFFACIFLYIFRKKIYLYLRSDGYEEWKHILGGWSLWIFHLMFVICNFVSEVIVCNKRISKKGHLISISRLNSTWFQNTKNAPLEKVKLLYVGRLSPEKGIYNFIKMFDKLDNNEELSIVGYSNNASFSNTRIKLLGYCSDEDLLKKIYDSHNITILPSYTEGYPYVIDESLSRKRPVIIFKEISYVINGKKGIFVSERDLDSLNRTIKLIIKNYSDIQKEISENKLPTKNDMIKQITNIIDN